LRVGQDKLAAGTTKLKMDVNDYLLERGESDWAALLADWNWILPAHFTAVSMWVEALARLPAIPRERRIAFCNGIGFGELRGACLKQLSELG